MAWKSGEDLLLASNKLSFFENLAGQVLEGVTESRNVEVESERLKNKLAFGREKSPPLGYQKVGGQTPRGPRDLLWIWWCLFRTSSVEGPNRSCNTQMLHPKRGLSRQIYKTWRHRLLEGGGSMLCACSHMVLASHQIVVGDFQYPRGHQERDGPAQSEQAYPHLKISRGPYTLTSMNEDLPLEQLWFQTGWWFQRTHY